jgi:tRNA (mo5U34)-methyltransferase
MEGPTQSEVDAMQWWHPFTFPNGVKARGTKGGGSSEYCEELVRAEAQCAFKYSVEGKTVLDVGAANGYFSAEAVRRGATKVVALDTWEFGGVENFELVRRYTPNIHMINRDVMDLRSNPIGKFDYVIFLGVLYHLRHPLYVLETLFDITIQHLVVETHIDLVDYHRPAMVFYPGAELNRDPSNWWGPNVQCVIDMLKTAGFSRVEHSIHPFVNDRAFFYALK